MARAGAGLSADFGFPPWHERILEIAETAGIRPDVETFEPLLATNAFEEAAELVFETVPNQFR